MRHPVGHGRGRRRFIRNALTLAAAAAAPAAAFASIGGTARLVVVLLRGAVDGLAAVPPYGDPEYANQHRELAIAAPGAQDGALRLDGVFGLHPALRFLHQRFEQRELLVFHAVASPYRDRSHFDGQNVLENGLAQPIGTADGWLNRAVARLRPGGTLERAVAIGQNLPMILRGSAPVLSKSPLPEAPLDEDLLTRLADLYSADARLAARLREAVQGARLVVGSGVVRGMDRVGASARLAATLMRGEGGPQIAVIEATGWDTHANQGAAQGALATRLASLDDALSALHDGLGAAWEQTAVLVMTEFGRTVAANGTRGTDHGTGGCALLVGGAVQGGRVIADWPGLARRFLLEQRDLRPTLDLRSVCKGVLAEHLRIDAPSMATRIFPDSHGARPLEGLIRA